MCLVYFFAFMYVISRKRLISHAPWGLGVGGGERLGLEGGLIETLMTFNVRASWRVTIYLYILPIVVLTFSIHLLVF